MCGWAGRKLNAESVLSLGVSALKTAVGRPGALCGEVGSIPAPPGRATRLRMLLRTRMSRAAHALIPHSLAYGLIGKHVG